MASSDKLVIIKYNAGNIQSVLYALERIGREANVTDDPDQIRSADKIIFPGVGEASSAMKYLRQRGLDQLLPDLKQPVLGICLGLQLMCTHSEENDTECLGIFDAGVKKFHTSDPMMKIPQIGWNNIIQSSGPLFKDLPEPAYAYFVHSYFAELCPETVAITEYAEKFSSGMQKDNFYGVQFHPEKSAGVGQKILENFLSV